MQYLFVLLRTAISISNKVASKPVIKSAKVMDKIASKPIIKSA